MSAIQELLQTMARLRAPGGCPWDIEQTHQTLCRNLVEETAELLEAIDHGDDPHMLEELGDVLLQVVFHAQMASERGAFDFESVARGINEKLIRRHPHVFGEASAEDSAAVLRQWDAIKAREKEGQPPTASVFKNLPPALPALLFASECIKMVKKRGLEVEAVAKEADLSDLASDAAEEAAGKQLFQMVAACHQKGVDPESALRRQTWRFMKKAEDVYKRG